MTYKHSFVDDYPFITYTSDPNAAMANSSDVASLDTRLDAIEASNWVTSARIKDGAVTTGKIADEAVTTGKIADGAVTADKLAGDDN